ncbi:MAG: extracellular solute-binding protein [Bacteroides sp.]|nr:extracellular solute-binding protein [Bacteroides sp.]
MKKNLCPFLAAAVALTASGCSPNAETHEEKEQVTIALWSDQLTEQYGKYLQESFPEVDFTFYVATNSADFFRFKEERGDLPDILTVRRFALRDVADWKDSLMDLGNTELAGMFHPSYLRSYTYEDGTVNWLPTCAEVDSIIVNKTLLEENGLSVPNNYDEFTEVCGKLRDKGIRPFLSNFSADYTCMEVLQGLSASALASQEGRVWRQEYESGKTNSLSEEVWLPVFERMEDFIEQTGLSAADLGMTYDEAFEAYTDGRAAMIRGTGDEIEMYISDKTESVLMPYYSDDENDNRYLTYPAFQIAASARAEESEERKRLILDIMDVMLGDEGLRKIASGQNMVSYSSETALDLSPSMSEVQPYVDSNRLYIRLASSDMFSVSEQVVCGMIAGDYPNARSALDAFNKALETEESGSVTAAHIDAGYSYAFDPNGGSRAASAIMNSVREETGTQLLIAPAAYAAGNIAEGDYTEEELRFLTMGESTAVVICDMTGEQIWKYLDYVLTVPEKRGSVINDSTLYVSSGFEMTVEKKGSGYSIKKLTVDGGELDREKTYSVTVIGSLTLMLRDAFEAAGVTEYTESDTGYKQMIVDRLMSGRQLAEPSDYITLL